MLKIKQKFKLSVLATKGKVGQLCELFIVVTQKHRSEDLSALDDEIRDIGCVHLQTNQRNLKSTLYLTGNQ